MDINKDLLEVCFKKETELKAKLNKAKDESKKIQKELSEIQRFIKKFGGSAKKTAPKKEKGGK